MNTEPYPGLRPFKRKEHKFFFGQDENIDELFQRLGKKHFIAVLGESGCGKSSLVRAGLIPMLVPLRDGAIVSWRVIITQPGMDPIHNLAQNLTDHLSHVPARATLDIEHELRQDPQGLIRIVDQCKDPTKRFLLIVVDQFEELFRFRREGSLPHRDDHAALYVKLLLNAAQSEASNVYILLTMRSEYLGESSQFYNLAEAISDGLFLLPRMKRVQCEDAIVQPALTAGRELPQAIVQRLLNETEDREDGLPLLQHGLRRLWDAAANGAQLQEISLPAKFTDSGKTDYVQWSLNDHLEKILAEINADQRKVAAKVFKLLGERDFKGRLIRRPTEWRDIKAVGPDEKTVLDVIDAFRDEELGRTFIVPSKQKLPGRTDDGRLTLKDDEKFDISHEVLLRKWDTYGKWLKEESEAAAQYEWLADDADRWTRKTGRLLQGLELVSLLKWREEFRPSAAWASRYTGAYDEQLKRNERDYDAAMKFLDESLEESRNAERARRWRWIKIVTAPALLTIFAVWLWIHSVNVQQDIVNVIDEADIANATGTMNVRVQAAIHAARLATGAAPAIELKRRVQLNQWELFSALRRGETFGEQIIFHLNGEGSGKVVDKATELSAVLQYSMEGSQVTVKVPSVNGVYLAMVTGNQMTGTWLQNGQRVRLTVTRAGAPAANHGNGGSTDRMEGDWQAEVKMSFGCNVSATKDSVTKDWKFAAIADGAKIQIWQLGSEPRFVTDDAFDGVDCVKFNVDGTQLLAISYSDQDNLAPGTDSSSRRSEVRRYLFDKKSLKQPDLGPDIKSLEQVESFVAASFVNGVHETDSESVAVLTSTGLSIYPAPKRRLPILPSVVQSGFFSPDGHYLVVSYRDGSAQVYNVNSYNVNSNEPPQPLPFSGVGESKITDQIDILQVAAFSQDSSRIITGSSLGWISVRSNPFNENQCFNHIDSMPVQMGSPISTVTIGAGAATDDRSNCREELLAAGTRTGDAMIFRRQPPNVTSGQTQNGSSGKTQSSASPPANKYIIIRCIHEDTPTRVSFSSDGKYLITASVDKKARVFEGDTGIETARIPHQAAVVYADEANLEILSVSQDSQLQVTKFGGEADRTVLRTSPPDSCLPSASAVSRKGDWVWACTDGRLHFSDEGMTKKFEKVQAVGVSSINFNQDSSTLVWADHSLDQSTGEREFSVHYAHAPTWTPNPVLRLNKTASFPESQGHLVTISSDGRFVGISFCPGKDSCDIELFEADDKQNLHPSKTIPTLDEYILSMVLGSEGSIVVGTERGFLRFYPSQGGRWSEKIAVSFGSSGSSNSSSANGGLITALALTANNDLVVATKVDYERIGLFSPDGKRQFLLNQSSRVVHDKAGADMFVLSPSGNKVAAITGSDATFFTLTDKDKQADQDKDIEMGPRLHEPGTIQSLAFLDDDTVITSVATQDSLVSNTHKLSIDKHEEWICRNLPWWAPATAQITSDCAALRDWNKWKHDDTFWGHEGEPAMPAATPPAKH